MNSIMMRAAQAYAVVGLAIAARSGFGKETTDDDATGPSESAYGKGLSLLLVAALWPWFLLSISSVANRPDEPWDA